MLTLYELDMAFLLTRLHQERLVEGVWSECPSRFQPSRKSPSGYDNTVDTVVYSLLKIKHTGRS